MNAHRRLLLVLAASGLCAVPAEAQILVYSTGIPGVAVPGTGSSILPAFDPALGILRWAEIRIACAVSGTLALENTNAFPAANGVSYLGALVYLSTASTNYPNPPNPAFESDTYTPVPPNMSAFDGTLDYLGASSTTYTFQLEGGTGGPVKIYGPITGDDLAEFVGPAGAPGVIGFQVQTTPFLQSFVPSGVMTSYALTATSGITIRYGYEPLPAPICLPQVYWNCPCGVWQQQLDRGCANSVSGGARLDVTGTPSISADSLVLLGTSMPDGPVLYFQGDEFGFASTPFGDGLLCVGGTIARLAIRFNSAGASSLPGPGDPSLSVLGNVLAPGDLYYQAYYRDAASFCTSATFNFANGFAVRWQP